MNCGSVEVLKSGTTLQDKMKTKIAHLTSVHPRWDVRVLYKECVYLAMAGLEVHLFVADGKGDEIVDGVEIHDLGVQYNNRLGRFFHTPNALFRKAIKFDCAIYHIHDPEMLQVIHKLKKRNKITIYDIHEDVPRQILTKSYIPRYLRKIISFLFEKYENFIVKKVDFLIVATPHICDRFKKHNSNTEIIRNYPINYILIDSEKCVKRNEICYFGGISDIRGINNILRAIGNIDVKIHLAGFFESDKYKQQLMSYPEWNKVIYHGLLSKQELQKLLAFSKIGLVTLLPMTNFIDALPVKMFEYMAAGVPVIASNFPLWKEIIEGNNCGICVNPNDPSEIGRAISYLLENESIALEMGMNGRKAVIQKYNWDNEGKRLIGIYSKLLEL
jgi:glycosyltransferase involved in cell wall biosynthesis